MFSHIKTLHDEVHRIVGGKHTYLVGGAVRDMTLGIEPKDFDFCTPVPVEDVVNRVKADGKRAYTLGARYGTVGFKVDGQMVEVTTIRVGERYEPPSRKPIVVFGTDINADLARRDFTINAMALREDGKLIDPHEGEFDCQSRILRAVGNPTIRFKEDPLRMLRAVRMCTERDMELDEATMRSIKKNAHLIQQVSHERWGQEIDRILKARYAAEGMFMLGATDLLAFMLPELAIQIGYEQNSKFHCLPLWEHTLGVVDGVPADIDLRWAALLHDIGKPAVRTEKPGRSIYVHHERVSALLVEGIADRFRWSKERTRNVKSLVRNHLEDASPLKAADDAAKKPMEGVS